MKTKTSTSVKQTPFLGSQFRNPVCLAMDSHLSLLLLLTIRLGSSNGELQARSLIAAKEISLLRETIDPKCFFHLVYDSQLYELYGTDQLITLHNIHAYDWHYGPGKGFSWTELRTIPVQFNIQRSKGLTCIVIVMYITSKPQDSLRWFEGDNIRRAVRNSGVWLTVYNDASRPSYAKPYRGRFPVPFYKTSNRRRYTIFLAFNQEIPSAKIAAIRMYKDIPHRRFIIFRLLSTSIHSSGTSESYILRPFSKDLITEPELERYEFLLENLKHSEILEQQILNQEKTGFANFITDDHPLWPTKAMDIINPFRLSKKDHGSVKFTGFIMFMALKLVNASIWEDNEAIEEREAPPGSVLEVDLFGSLNDIPGQFYPRTYIQASQERFKFLTCYSEPHLSFEYYIRPFQPSLWGTLIGSGFFIAGVLHVYIKLCKKEIKSYPSLFFILSSLIEEAYPIPESLQKDPVFRIFIGVWVMMSLVFTNAYLGLAISDLSSPLPTRSPETFKDLTVIYCNSKSPNDSFSGKPCFNKFWVHAFKVLRRSKRQLNVTTTRDFDKSKDFRLYSSLSVQYQYTENEVPNTCKSTFGYFLCGSIWDRYADRYDNLLKQVNDDISMILISLSYPFHLFNPGNADPTNLNDTIGYNAAVEIEVLKCTNFEKTALVDLTKNIELEQQYLSNQYPQTKFVQSKESILGVGDVWVFGKNWDIRVVPGIIQTFISSGIYSTLKDHFDSGQYAGRKEKTAKLNEYYGSLKITGKSANMHSSIQTVFILYSSLIGITLGFFAMEMRTHFAHLMMRHRRSLIVRKILQIHRLLLHVIQLEYGVLMASGITEIM